MAGIKNQTLLDELKSANIILTNGKVNTCWKKMIKKKYSHLVFNDRFELFSAIWDFPEPLCKICNKSMFSFSQFQNPNFLNGENAFHSVCSKKCQNKLTSEKISIYRKNKDIEKIRVEKFKQTVCNKDELGNSIASRIAVKAAKTKATTIVDGISVLERQNKKSYETRVKKGKQIPNEQRTSFYLYRKQVIKLSEKEPLHLLENYKKRGHFNNNGYHLDHIFSIFDGHRLNIPSSTIASIVNLRFIPAKQNTTKSRKSEMHLRILIQKYFDYTVLKIPLNDILYKQWYE